MFADVADKANDGRALRTVEHDPEKWIPVFRKDHAQIKEIERDDDSKKSHHALGDKTGLSLAKHPQDQPDA
jgi:hypothetical protein